MRDKPRDDNRHLPPLSRLSIFESAQDQGELQCTSPCTGRCSKRKGQKGARGREGEAKAMSAAATTLGLLQALVSFRVPSW